MSVWLPTLTSFVLLLAVFLPLEKLFPAQEQRVLRREWGQDLLFFLGQYLLWTVPVIAVLVFVHDHAADVLPLTGVRAAVASQPFWLQFLEVIVLCDIGIYWAHRWSHSNAFLWRFHRVHHTAVRLDWIAAHREHPFDNLFTRFVENLPAILMGFDLRALAGFAMFRGMWAIYIHSNVSLTPGKLGIRGRLRFLGNLQYLIGSPRLHHWHHDLGRRGRVNYANLSPLMDLLFGTYHDPGHMPKAYGIADRISHNYFVQMLDPLLPGSVRERLHRRVQKPS